MKITVAIPSIPQRKSQLRKAITSVGVQNYPAAAISVAIDLDREGSAPTRNRALAGSQTAWTAFLDDDDVFLMHHLEVLAYAAEETGADVVYGLPRVITADGSVLPRRLEFGGPPVFDPDLLRKQSYITVASLVRTELAKDCGGFRYQEDGRGNAYDDHGFYLNMLDAGAQFHHVEQETFLWNHHGKNTSGRPDRGDAAR